MGIAADAYAPRSPPRLLLRFLTLHPHSGMVGTRLLPLEFEPDDTRLRSERNVGNH